MTTATKLSEMMVQLYGKKDAQAVYDRCQEIDPWFNQYVQTVVYDQLWALEPLSLTQKSLVTIVVLAILKKEEQLQIHLKGFFNLGGTHQDITQLFSYLLTEKQIDIPDKLFSILHHVNAGNTEKHTTKCDAFLTPTNRTFINLAALIATGDHDKMKTLLADQIHNKTLSQDEIKGTFRHAMTYCGCPCAMNAFALLREVQEKH
jgi:alkylhydroperoxidase/carboxymuconolactone decarboxylase family protein YurZ